MPPAERSPAGATLTDKQLNVLLLLAAGESRGQVAAAIGRSINTVTGRVSRILIRTETHSLASALAVAVARGEVHIPVERGEPLPERQQQVLIGIARGLSDEQIGKSLELSHHTVKKEAILLSRTLKARSRIHLVYLGFKTGNLTINRRKQNG